MNDTTKEKETTMLSTILSLVAVVVVMGVYGFISEAMKDAKKSRR